MYSTAHGPATSGLDVFGQYFSTPEMLQCFDARALVDAWADVEAALARSQADLGIIPPKAAEAIASVAGQRNLDLEAVQEEVFATWHPLMGLIRELRERCGDHGEYVHWGATTQDIMDTGSAVQHRHGLILLEDRLHRLVAACAALADDHADTVMAGRTHGQHALPTTFGAKAGGWTDEVGRHLARLDGVADRVLVTNLTGAVGSMAALHPDGNRIQERAAELLGLSVPVTSWHATRDRIAELLHWLASLGNACGRIAGEVIALQKTEIAELSEPYEFGKIGSSTMPQKRNPMAAEAVVACSVQLSALAGVGLDAMRGEHERDMAAWAAEWRVVPEAFRLLDAALTNTLWIVDGLVVDKAAMRDNMAASKGLMLSEAVMMQLAEQVGRQRAHDLVYEVAMAAWDDGIDLTTAIGQHEEARELLTDGDGTFRPPEPEDYIGHAPSLARAAASAARDILEGRVPLAQRFPVSERITHEETS